MPDAVERLSAALSDRYRFERELGQGGQRPVDGEPVVVPNWIQGSRNK